jgi:hypothetical protein
MVPHSRLPLHPSTQLPSIQSFGELSEFLRSAIADEDSRELSENMALLAQHSEAIIAGLRLSRRRTAIGPMLMDLLTVLRSHRNEVVALPLAWRGLYEYAAYLQALNNFRVLAGQWLLEGASPEAELSLTAEDFELVTWRTLGEGMLLIDMYEQWCAREQQGQASALAALEDPRLARAVQWWKRLRLP